MSINAARLAEQLATVMRWGALIWHGSTCAAITTTASLPDSSLLNIVSGSPTGAGLTARYLASGRVSSITLSHDLRLAAQGTDQLRVVGQRAVVLNSRTFIVMATQTSSTSRQGTGFCGAGTEDHLLLTEWLAGRRQLLLRDALLVQSCQHALSLWSDAGGDAFAALTTSANPARMQWSWVQHPTYGDHPVTVSIENARFVIKPTQPVPDSGKDR